jgi:hypothetical protein
MIAPADGQAVPSNDDEWDHLVLALIRQGMARSSE